MTLSSWFLFYPAQLPLTAGRRHTTENAEDTKEVQKEKLQQDQTQKNPAVANRKVFSRYFDRKASNTLSQTLLHFPRCTLW